MSLPASNLSDPNNGNFDLVVATTQNSINATMKEYLSSLAPDPVYILFMYSPSDVNGDGPPIQVTYDTLVQACNGTDPFSVPANAEPNDPALQNLFQGGFVAGIKFIPGLPTNYTDVAALPNIITLQQDSASVIYNMLCADIQTREMKPNRRGQPVWTVVNQNDSPNVAWEFQSSVNLAMNSAQHAALPPNIQDSIKNLDGSMFSVQQLLFDLNNAGLQSTPTINGLDPTSATYTYLTTYFLDSYFHPQQTKGLPVLNYVVVHKTQDATLKPTDLNFHVGPLHSSSIAPGLMTLDYICATNGDTLNAAKDFPWDWMDNASAAQADGVIAINRNTFRDYLYPQILTTALNDCYNPSVSCTATGWGSKSTASMNGHPAASQLTQSKPDTGAEVISISWSGSDYDQAGVDGALGHCQLDQTYTKTVSFSGNTITIVTHQLVYLSVKDFQTTNAANVVDKTITDVYTLGVDAYGTMTFTKTSTPVDNSSSDSSGGFVDFFTDINDTFDNLKSATVTDTSIDSTPIAAFQSFFFPGGQTFTFKDCCFSSNQDLCSFITYTDPSN